MKFLERMFVDVLHDLAQRRPEELRRLGRPPEELTRLEGPFPRLSYAEAIERLQGEGFPVAWGSDLGTAEERALTISEKSPIFLTRFPKEVKAFYMLRTPGDPRTVEGADLLGPRGTARSPGRARARPMSWPLPSGSARPAPTSRSTNGISICGGTGACPTPGLASGSSACSGGS